MTTLIVVEHSQQGLHSATSQLLTAALQFKRPISVLVVGEACASVAVHAASLAGVDDVLLADQACYRHQLPENVSQLVAAVAVSYTHVLMLASAWGRAVLPRVAAHLDCAQVSEVTAILSEDTLAHSIYAGQVIETVKLFTTPKLMTIRVGAFAALDTRQTACAIHPLTLEYAAERTTWLQHEPIASQRPSLTQASRVVSAGRGLRTAEQFKWVEELADALGAAVGGTPAAVDAGFIAARQQIGQTGQMIAPSLYIAIGISGAIQHTAGMDRAQVIVAINHDPEAPIMQIAHYALVGDLSLVLPELIQRLKQE